MIKNILITLGIIKAPSIEAILAPMVAIRAQLQEYAHVQRELAELHRAEIKRLQAQAEKELEECENAEVLCQKYADLVPGKGPVKIAA